MPAGSEVAAVVGCGPRPVLTAQLTHRSCAVSD